MTPQDVELPPFRPALGLSNGHVMTIAAWGKPRRYPGLPAPDTRFYPTEPGTTVRGDGYWQPDRARVPTLVALHGLEGSSEGHYMRGLALQAWRRGWNAVLLNHRNCGGTEHLTPTLYHSGLTADAFAVMRTLAHEGLPWFGVAGYSLGGNLTLRMAGEHALDPEKRSLPIRAVAAVSPTMDLQVCTDAIERPENTLYDWNFLRDLSARLRRKHRHWPGRFDLAPLARVRTIRDFDDAYTAPAAGFGTADNYYRLASAIRLIDRVAVPTLVVSAEDDPFVPPEQFQRPEVTGNPHVRVMLTRHGGHCGFLGRDGYWAEATAVRFIAAFMPS